MPEQNFSDEQLYQGIERVVDSICSQGNYVSSLGKEFHDNAMKRLSESGYGTRMSWAFFRASYWFMQDSRLLRVETTGGGMYYSLTEKMKGKNVDDICMLVFGKYEGYLQANYQRSLTHPAIDNGPSTKEPAPEKKYSAGK